MMSFEKIIIATGNRGKYEEFCEIIKNIAGNDFAHGILFAPNIAKKIIDETGKTYAENAFLKARAWAEFTGSPCLADDSGLEVNALNGAPGLFSSRVVKGSDSEKVSWLLSKLAGVSNRSARFAASLALCWPEKFTLITEGYCYGKISLEPKGTNGFGYDPVFIPDGYEKTFAELSQETKNNISHRTNAFRKIFAILENIS